MSLNKQYGIFIGRFQPFHLGHQHVINYIMLSGLKPVVAIGSAQHFGTDKNPFTANDRYEMLRKVYKPEELKMLSLSDVPGDDKEWVKNFKFYLWTYCGATPENSILFYNKKAEDCIDGEHYIETCFKDVWELQDITESLPIKLDVSASKIREDLEGNKHFLDARVYKFIKRLQDRKDVRI